ncbi:MAG: glycosyltransferase family 2 protein [Opitutaceae bacterium]|nr:glycosyltransferase family 2 protein [Opitutaceae bacterium]
MSAGEKITVIMATRARPHLLPRAVASVFAQTHPDFELLVVDDNPPADRAATTVALAPWRDDPHLRYLVNADPCNGASARNTGLGFALGEWVTFLDDDDTYEPMKLARQLALARATGAPLVLCGLAYHAGMRVRRRQCREERFAGGDLLVRAQAAAPAIFHQRVDSFRFDAEFFAGEDADYFLRLVEHWSLASVPNVPAPLVHVFQQDPALRQNTRAEAVLRGQRRIWHRHSVRFSRSVRRQLAARIWYAREIEGRGFGSLGKAASWVWRTGGPGEWRLLANLFLRRLPVLGRWMSV